jgi:hypothetical protein
MRLYDVEDSAQTDIVDSGQEDLEKNLVKRFTSSKPFDALSYD